MSNTNPAESMEAEGLPELEDHPPGMDVELDQETMMAPRDHPVAAGDDPAYPTTAAEDRIPEGVAERAERENPDVGAEDLGVGGSVQGSRAKGPRPGGAAEEDAVHVRSEDDDL